MHLFMENNYIILKIISQYIIFCIKLDRVSQKIMQIIVNFQSEQSLEGTPIKFNEYDRVLLLNRHISLIEIQRYRRQYVKINQQHPPHSSIDIGTSFIDYLALQI